MLVINNYKVNSFIVKGNLDPHSMFSNSYNPISFEQLSPGSSTDMRKREDQARRQRMQEEAKRRRLARLERIRRMEEQLRKEEIAREMEIYHWRHVEEEDQQRSKGEEGEDRGDDDDNMFISTSFPPQFIYTTISKSQDEVEEPTVKLPPKVPSLGLESSRLEGQNMHHSSRYCNDFPVPVPNINLQAQQDLPNINLQAQHSHQEERQEVIDETMKIDDDNDTSVPPHIIANDVLDDDNEIDEDDDILNSIWEQVPSPPLA